MCIYEGCTTGEFENVDEICETHQSFYTCSCCGLTTENETHKHCAECIPMKGNFNLTEEL